MLFLSLFSLLFFFRPFSLLSENPKNQSLMDFFFRSKHPQKFTHDAKKDGTTGDPVIFPSRTGTFTTFFIFPLTVVLISRSFVFFCIIDDVMALLRRFENHKFFLLSGGSRSKFHSDDEEDMKCCFVALLL